MMSKGRLVTLVSATCTLFLIFGSLVASAQLDFGRRIEDLLQAKSEQQFGIVQGVSASSTESIDVTAASANPLRLATLAKGLKARVITSGTAAPNLDMMALWPNSADPEWIIECNEQGPSDPGLQRINIASGAVETILSGTDSCDPAHLTPWGTIVFAEESGSSGHFYELMDPINTTGVTLDRETGTFSGGTGAANIVERPALGNLSYEGVAVYPNGVVYYGDENRPSEGTPGGAYYKFVPTTLRDETTGPITSLDQSPLASGTVYGLRLGKRHDNTDYGQGTQTGLGTWIETTSADLRAEAASLNLTGYYRPEDISIDESALNAGLVRFCGNNTGNEEDDRSWGNTICVTDGTLTEAGANSATPEVQYFQLGTPERQMVDNIAYQPGRGNWVLHEDADISFSGKNDDLWVCLPDGSDDDLLSDGCIRFATLNDSNAEWTGGMFDASGQHFYVSVQHNVTGYGVLLDITGWK